MCHLTKHLRVIPNAWHFHSMLVFVFTVVWFSFVVALLTP
ncbi:DUF3265 domain-containing protein [Vibrio cholerae]|nr:MULTISPECIES: DUF3265 domain-containing protein [Vibrio]EGR1702075.1 DUF3265 domain-containing protein [Vibrio cholerae]EGR2416393.1 DUF3265 domain-containing protein [Vibrio cholerae]EGR4374065.1 DUF3265 domain-containing protein [Vibrio cholerae]KAA1206813.1 DUF3265 domain-containing protein [Vibrio cholerae]KAA1220701.1 DUF3265 domain-containing protein [Vibrio cholerae]